MPVTKRDTAAYAVIASLALAGAYAIHLNAVSGMENARARFTAESHANALTAASAIQKQFDAIFQNLRTISRLPSVRAIDREGTTISKDSTATIQEIYNNLASNVDVSEIYIVPRDLNAEKIDPATGQPQTPILMFDNLISPDDSGANVTKHFEAEIYEYHLLHDQMLWFAAHTPDLNHSGGLNVPMISGQQVITCDNSVYNATLHNDDRTGTIFSVPFFGTDNAFKGTISGIVRIKALRAVLPAENYALVNPGYHATWLSTGGEPADPAIIAQARPDPALIYSEVLPLSVNDPQYPWSLWTGQPNSAFFNRPDVRAVQSAQTAGYAVLALLTALAIAAVFLSARNAALIARAASALARLAGGDEASTLAGAERRGPVGDLARAFATFRDALTAKRIAEDQAHASSVAAAAAKTRLDAERAATLAAQKNVVDILAGALINLTSGDLTQKITQAFEGEYSALPGKFNEAAAKMEGTIQRVSANAHGVETTAREVAQAADNFARRTEQQAAGLEETAAALGEITAAVKRTAVLANDAAKLAATAREDAGESSGVVTETVAAMGGIADSSARITNIIGVIDEIAFQTNLLALNAGVEAARAGDAGRGFAVVATEVRALAQRSAEAAKEIKSLISASGSEVGNGVRLVNETGAALERITGQINQLADLAHEIADAAKGQSNTLAQVNMALDNMDKATQQNAAMVEEMAAAGGGLTKEAASLSQLVDEFKITKIAPTRLAMPARRRVPASAH